ncbi:vWA domain-containing protein [Aestuariimicrobium soli]|uniref:vWA domain-containing protein n=1 Tax=Aestuariimicrobium soli TaxID=2035834 RepID=UPI003EB8A3C6
MSLLTPARPRTPAQPQTVARPGTLVRASVTVLLSMLVVIGTTVLGAGPARAETPGKLLLVLDSSGSMAEKAGDGKTRMEAAKTAMTTVVDTLAADANVGLRVYGAKVFDKKSGNACADSQLVVPIGTNNKAALKKAIGGFKPYGETPISYALEQAGKDVGASGQRSIVLISDGEETCTTDPCVAAQKLANQGIDVRIDVVGFDVAGKAKQQLQCVAKVGRGQYTDVKDTKELTDQLNQAKKRASEPFEVSGTPVTGSADPAKAPAITAATWSDTMPAPGQKKYYRLERTMTRSTFWAGLTMTPTLSADKNFAFTVMKIVPQDEEYPTCGSSYPYAWTSRGRTAGMMTGRTTSAGRRADAVADCQTKQLVLSIEADDADDAPDLSKQKFQLNVFEEPPAANADALPEAVPDDQKLAWTAVKHGKATKVATSTSLTKAPTVQPGTVTFDIVPGEFRVMKVPVGWGQRLQAMLTTGELPQYRRSGAADKMELMLLAPLGGEANARFDKAPYGDSDLLWYKGTQLGAGTREVRYNNRHAVDESSVAAGLAGDYYVVVTLSKEPGSPANAIPITLTLSAIGKAATGAPTYEEPSSPEGSASPTPSAEATDETGAPSGQASTPAATPTSGSSTTPDDSSSGGGKNWPLIGGLAGFGLLLGGFSVWFANRTRRRP